MNATVRNNSVILEIPCASLRAGCKAAGIRVLNEEEMLKHVAAHLLTDETLGEDLEINRLLDGIMERAIESAEPWCEIAEGEA